MSQIHDAQLDYYGRRVASCTSDGALNILEVVDNDTRNLASIRAHEGPVWQACWSHPKFGNMVVSSGYDGRAVVSKEDKNQWRVVGEFSEHSASLNCVAFAPPELGCVFACGSSDGRVSVVKIDVDAAGQVTLSKLQTFHAHQVGVNCLSWSPNSSPQFVTGGGDSLVKIWKSEPDCQNFISSSELKGHSDWVRDVCWSPCTLATQCIASGAQDKRVFLWTLNNDQWEKSELCEPFNDCVFRTSFSLSGNILAVSSGDNKVSLWKESVDGWVKAEN